MQKEGRFKELLHRKCKIGFEIQNSACNGIMNSILVVKRIISIFSCLHGDLQLDINYIYDGH